MGAGAVVRLDDPPGERKVLSRSFGPGTNNQAEYRGLILGLRHALGMGANRVTVRGDSELVLKQLKGEYSVKAPGLKALHDEARLLLARFRQVKLEWIPREQNGEADQASKDAAARPPDRS